jgi:cytochrome c peroxidase
MRLCWHAAGTYDKTDGSGGSCRASMRFEPESKHGANAGLDIARAKMEKIKKMYPKISYADLWSLGGLNNVI